jgi:hypothetical protein
MESDPPHINFQKEKARLLNEIAKVTILCVLSLQESENILDITAGMKQLNKNLEGINERGKEVETLNKLWNEFQVSIAAE